MNHTTSSDVAVASTEKPGPPPWYAELLFHRLREKERVGGDYLKALRRFVGGLRRATAPNFTPAEMLANIQPLLPNLQQSRDRYIEIKDRFPSKVRKSDKALRSELFSLYSYIETDAAIGRSEGLTSTQVELHDERPRSLVYTRVMPALERLCKVLRWHLWRLRAIPIAAVLVVAAVAAVLI